MRSTHVFLTIVLLLSFSFAANAANVSSCQVISSGGLYELNTSLVGALGAGNPCIDITANNVVLDCKGYTITNDGTNTAYGIRLNGPTRTNVTVRNCPNISQYVYGIYVYYSDGNTFTNNTVYNNSRGYYLYYSDDNDVTNSTMTLNSVSVYSQASLYNTYTDNMVYGNNGYGFYLLQGSHYSNISNSTIYDNGGYGISFNNADDCHITGNEIYDHYSGTDAYGIYLISGSNGNTISDNEIYDNEGNNFGYGIRVATSSNNVIAGNHVYDNAGGSGGFGFYVVQSYDNTVANSTIHDHPTGFYSNDATTTTLYNNTVYNSNYGVHINRADTVITGGHYYNNTATDLRIQYGVTPSTLNATGLVFDNPAGNFEKYTTLSINDTVDVGYYDIEWTTNSTALPPGANSFEGKFVDITRNGAVVIDSIIWHWTTPEINVGEYDESSFEIWKYNGTWSNTNAALNANANTLSLTNMNPASTYGLFGNVTPLNITAIELFGANITNITQHARYNGTAAGNLSTEGGNMSGVNINSTQLTDRWAAFYGNVSGSILLRGATGSNYVYSWSWDASEGGVVCVSTNSSIGQLSAAGALGSDIDTAWSFTASATDSGANTFNLTNCTLNIGASSISNASYVDTGSLGGFITCSLKSVKTPAKPQMLFCTDIISGGTAWNGDNADFELMVPTNDGPSATETYYFYANLN